MGKVLPALDENLTAFIERQHVFFVATAPDGPEGHVNVSPKGLDTFRVLDDRTVAIDAYQRERNRSSIDGLPALG